jgi:hypothetical protein
MPLQNLRKKQEMARRLHELSIGIFLEEPANDIVLKRRSTFYFLDTVFSTEKSVHVKIVPRSHISQWEHTIQFFHKLGKYKYLMLI